MQQGRILRKYIFHKALANEISSSSILSSLLERVPSFELSEDAINKVSYRQHGSEFIGVAKTWDLKLRSPIDLDWKLVLVLDEVEKPGNLGAILRTAEALGVDAILLSDSCVDFFNPNVVRSSMGLFSRMPVFMAEKREVHEFLKQANLEIVGTSSKAQISIYEKEFQSKVAMVMGSESTGLGEFWEKHCDSMITIPMIGRASSLNLNCATTGVLMEINRRRQQLQAP